MRTLCRPLLLAIAVLQAASLRAADYVTTVNTTPGLLGNWRYTTATGANSSVNGYTGTFNGNAALGAPGTGPSLAADPGNRPVVLDGTNNTYVDTNLTGVINQTGSIIGWFNLAALPSAAGHIFTVAGQSQIANDFDVQIETDNVLRLYTNSGGAVAVPTAFTATDLNTWFFFAATFTSGGNATIYLNGVQSVTGAAGTHSLSNGTFAMGASDVFGGRFFQGRLDEVAVFNRELTSSEVASIYASASVVPEPSTWAGALAGIGLLIALRYRRAV